MKKAFLFLLGLIAFIGVQAQTSPYTGSEAAAGNFYIYNVETGYWLQNNNRVGDWNSQVQVDTEGFDWELIARDDGTWQLNPKFGSNHSLNSADANGYMDTGQPVSAWTLTPANDGNNGYMISSNGTTLGVNLDTKLLTKDGSGGTTWQLVTFAERWRVTEQKFSEVTGDNPMDLTWLIPGANMNIADEHFNDLIKVAPNSPGNFTTGQTNVAPGNGVREVWSNTNGGYDFGYKVTNLPAGVYRFTVKGYYSDGPRRDVGAKYKEGTEVIRPQVYANDKSQPILSICAPEKSSAVNGCNTNSSGIFVPNNTGEASQATAAGLYDNPAIKIVLADGADEIDLGVKCEEAGIGDDWVILDKFQLVYYGPDNIESSLALLNAAIEEAENWDQSNTSTAMANMLNEAIDDARAKLSSTDSDEVEAAADALKAALKAAQAVDVSVLKATVELAKAEGIETTEAEQVIENATDGGAIGTVLNDLRVARKVAHLETDEATYEGNEPAEGDFYLYNVGRKAYLSSGSDWGTHAILGYPGLQATLAARDGGFTFQFNELIQGDARDKFMNASPYLDGEAGWATTYIFEPVEGKPGVYHIKGDGRGYLAFDPNGEVDGGGIKHFNTVTSLWATPEGEDAEWMLITKEQRLAQLENASKENPVDATVLIRDASFNKFAALDNPWTNIDQGWGWGDRNFGDKNTESWNSQEYNLSQEITFPKAGKYIVSVQAYYRDGDRDTHANKVKNGEALHDAPVLYAGDFETPIVYIDSEADKAPGEGEVTVVGEYPNYMNQAAAFFQNGLYKNTLEIVVNEDNAKLTIGIKKTGSGYTGADWTIADNFRLTYLGGASDYDRALVSIKDGQSYRVFTEIDGEKYYINDDGRLVSDVQKAGTYSFKKIAGPAYEYGFLLNSGVNTRFSNPPGYGNDEVYLNCGYIGVSSASRADFDAQVFFENTDGKFAIRSTNVVAAESGWASIADTYWTIGEGPVAQYKRNKDYIWQIEENEDPRPAILAEIKPITDTWGRKMQEINGIVNDASMYSSNAWINESIGLPGLLDGDYETYFHTTWQGGVTESHYLQAELPEATDKFYFYFVKRDPVANKNVNNRPTDILISGSNDGETFTEITEITEGLPAIVPPIDYMSGLVSADEPYKFIRFTVLDTNNHANDQNGNKFFTFSEFYILPSDELFDEAASLWFNSYTEIPMEDAEDLVERVNDVNDRLNAFFKDVDLNLVLNDEVLATVETTILIGKEAPAAPTSFYSNDEVKSTFNGLVYFKPDADEVTAETDAINYVAESAISESFENAKWFNMTIRGQYWVAMDETEPYYPTVDKDLEAEASQWAFGAVEGEPNQVIIWNRAAGADMSLLNTGESDSNGKPLVAMREGQTAWDYAINADGFVIHQVGTGDNEWVNQNGGATGPFSIWNSGSAKGDAGSVLRIFFVEETAPVDPYEAALAEIKDGHHYRVFTEVDGEKYYVTAGGSLSTSVDEAPSFLFQKTQTTSGSYEYGFKLNNNGTYFSNPPNTNEESLKNGHINTNGSGRDTWEAQVFFLNEDGLYAVRSTNAPEGGAGTWEWIGSAYWTVNEGPVAEYQWEPNYVWQLEEDMSYIELALNLVYNGEVVETQPATYQVGDTPAIPNSFYDKMADELFGLVSFSSDVDEVTEETTEVNFTAESILSESFEDAKWFNMHIRGLHQYAPFWVNKDETEPYYPTGDKDITAPESQWAFTSADGEPNHIIIWNRADDSAMTLTDADGNVVMREGDFVWEVFPNNTGFVMRPLGGEETHWVNQNGGNTGPLQFWNSTNGKTDDGSTFRVVPVEADNLEFAIDVERYVGLGYDVTNATVDFTEAKEILGIEEVTEDMLYFVNPDGTEIAYADYLAADYDGWCAEDGSAANWNTTSNMINVKFFQAIPDGAFTICDMNGADEVGKTYTVKWALKANDKSVVYSVNVTFVDAPVTDLTFDDLDVVSTEELDVQSELGSAYEGLSASVDIAAILAALEVESLDEVTITAVQPDGSLDLNYQRGTTDGWRDADGTWMDWAYAGDENENLDNCPYFYVKANFANDPQLYEIGGYPGHTDEAAKFTAPYAFIVTGTTKAYVLNVNLIYGESGAVAYEGTVDVTGKIQGQVVDEAPTADETVTITPNEDGTVNISFASLSLAAPPLPVNDFTIENVVVTENEDGSKSYSLEGATVALTAASGMIMTYGATLTGTQAEGEGPAITLVLAQPSGLQNEIVFNPNPLTPEAEEFDGMIKQILSHPQTGVQGQATGDQKVTIAATGDGKADITYSGFTMPVTGAEIPEFTVEGVIVTENEDGTISYALPEDAEAEVVIDRGTGIVKYAVTLEGTQESADATPVLKLTLENSVIDTVWFGADEKTIDKAIATSIRGINALGTEGTIYDLSGRKVEKIQRGGIYIVNGKKVSVK